MKIQLYTMIQRSGENSILRKKDGVYTLLNPVAIEFFDKPFDPSYYTDSPGKPVDQSVAEAASKTSLLLDRSCENYKIVNKFMYGIPEDAEIYPACVQDVKK